MGFNHGFDLKTLLQRACNLDILLKMYTDSECLFDVFYSLNTTSEKRILIDLGMLRQSYENRDILEVSWIPGMENPADALTKCACSNAL